MDGDGLELLRVSSADVSDFGLTSIEDPPVPPGGLIAASLAALELLERAATLLLPPPMDEAAAAAAGRFATEDEWRERRVRAARRAATVAGLAKCPGERSGLCCSRLCQIIGLARKCCDALHRALAPKQAPIELMAPESTKLAELTELGRLRRPAGFVPWELVERLLRLYAALLQHARTVCEETEARAAKARAAEDIFDERRQGVLFEEKKVLLDETLAEFSEPFGPTFARLVDACRSHGMEAGAGLSTAAVPGEATPDAQRRTLALGCELLLQKLTRRSAPPTAASAAAAAAAAASAASAAAPSLSENPGFSQSAPLARETQAAPGTVASGFEMGRALVSALNAPPVLWQQADDDLYLRLLGTPTEGEAALEAARTAAAAAATADAREAAEAVAAADAPLARRLDWSAGGGGSSLGGGGAPPMPLSGRGQAFEAVKAKGTESAMSIPWVRALLVGGCSEGFALAAPCVATMAAVLESAAAGAIDGDSSPLAAPIAAVLRVAVLRNLWRFLDDADGATQHEAAFLWVRLQALWPDACAAVLAQSLRGAMPPADASLGRHFAAPSYSDEETRLVAAAGEALAAALTSWALLWRAALLAKVGGGCPLLGVGSLHALDALQHPSAKVRAVAQRWGASMSASSAGALALLQPLLTLLVHSDAPSRLRLYALSKLRALLSSVPTVALLHAIDAPAALLASSRAAMAAAPLAPDVLPPRGRCSLLRLLAAGTLFQVLLPPGEGGAPKEAAGGGGCSWVGGIGMLGHGILMMPSSMPTSPSGASSQLRFEERLRFDDNSAQVLATDLMTALLHATPGEVGGALSAALLPPVLRILRASVGASGGAQVQLLALAFAALCLGREAWGGSSGATLAALLVGTIRAGIAEPHSAAWAHWVGFSVACLPHCAITAGSKGGGGPHVMAAEIVTVRLPPP